MKDILPLLQYCLVFVISKCLSLIPLSKLHGIARFYANRAIKKNSKRYAITRKNIQLCLPNYTKVEQQALAIESIHAASKHVVEIPHLFASSHKKCMSYINAVHGAELLDAAASQDNSTMIIGPHIGNSEMIGVYISSKYPICALYKPEKNSYLEKFITTGRVKNGNNLSLLPTNPYGIKRLVMALRQNGMVWISPDHNPDSVSSIDVPFFNLQTPTSILTAKLIKQMQPTVLIAQAIRIEDKFNIIFNEPSTPLVGDLEQITTAVNANLEQCIKQNITQYQWHYDRFRHIQPT